MLQRVGPTVCLLAIRVLNEGSIDIESAEVTLRLPSLEGHFRHATESPGNPTVYAVVDEAGLIDEFDETNNARAVIVH